MNKLFINKTMADIILLGAKMTKDSTEYQEYDMYSLKIAKELYVAGFKTGERIMILSDNCTESTIAFLGIARAGLVSVPINSETSKENIAKIIAEGNIKAVFVSSSLVSKLPSDIIQFNIEDFVSLDVELDHSAFYYELPYVSSSSVAVCCYKINGSNVTLESKTHSECITEAAEIVKSFEKTKKQKAFKLLKNIKIFGITDIPLYPAVVKFLRSIRLPNYNIARA